MQSINPVGQKDVEDTSEELTKRYLSIFETRSHSMNLTVLQGVKSQISKSKIGRKMENQNSYRLRPLFLVLLGSCFHEKRAFQPENPCTVCI